MISIIAETKSKSGLINKFKQIVYKDRDLWSFTYNDPKQLAYYLSGLELAKRTSGYGASDSLYEVIVSVGDETADIKQPSVMPFTEPTILLKKFSDIDLTDEAINKIIDQELNPERISVGDVKKVVGGLLEYLRYQGKRGVLVRFVWD